MTLELSKSMRCSNDHACFTMFDPLAHVLTFLMCSFLRVSKHRPVSQVGDVQTNAPVRIILPFKDQRSADLVRRQLSDLGQKINSDLRPVFTSKKIPNDIKVAETKPPLRNQQ